MSESEALRHWVIWRTDGAVQRWEIDAATAEQMRREIGKDPVPVIEASGVCAFSSLCGVVRIWMKPGQALELVTEPLPLPPLLRGRRWSADDVEKFKRAQPGDSVEINRIAHWGAN